MFIAVPLGNLTEAANLRSCLAAVCALNVNGQQCSDAKPHNLLGRIDAIVEDVAQEL